MLNGYTYSNRIIQLLERQFSGKASTQELEELNNFMQQDELFAEAFSNADLTVLQNAQEIALNANERISEIIKPAKPFGKQYLYYGISALVIILSLWYFWPTQDHIISKKDIKLALPVEKNKETITSADEIVLVTDENPKQAQKQINHEQKIFIENNEDNTNVLDESSPDENTLITEAEIEKKKKEEREKENKQILKSENTANQVDYSTLPAAVRVQHVQVMSKINAAESENTTRNNDVTNPNIGDPITKKKNNTSYNLDDMPYYLGNDAGFTGYISRKLSGAVILPRNKIPNSATVRFVVNSKGKVESSEVIGNIPPQLEKEILKIINEAPDWQPGKLTGKKGKLEYMIAIYFGY